MMIWLNLDEKGPRGTTQVPVGKSRNKRGGKSSIATVLSCKPVITVGRGGRESCTFRVLHASNVNPCLVNTSV